MKQNHKITYILGAGASANVLPTVVGSERRPSYTQALKNAAQNFAINSQDIHNMNPLKNKIIEDLNWLSQMGEQEQSIDGFCKYCCNKGNMKAELERAKFALSFFFCYEQFVEHKTDKRYRKFLHEILNNKQTFPSNISIINWNYDFQMQLACQRYKREHFEYKSDVSIHNKSLIHYYPAYSDGKNDDTEFQMIHMNGIAGFYHCNTRNAILSDIMNNGVENVHGLLNAMSEYSNTRQNLLTFAFEEQNGFAPYSDKFRFVERMISGTDVLVVIGYSFDSVNHEIDEMLLDILDRSGNLKKIYIQNPSTEEIDICDRFNLRSENINIRHEYGCYTFKVPYELKKYKYISPQPQLITQMNNQFE